MEEKLYTTLKGEGFFETVIDKSRFIGYAKHVTEEKDAVEFINSIRKKHADARHNVYAYVLKDTNTTRYSDDGEPAGTAGMPVLDVIRKTGFTDAVIVVTRYFGGILLGTGGLARAYSGACKLAVESADIMEMHSCSKITLRCDYTLYGRISQLLPQFEVKTISEDFAEAVSLTTLVKSELVDKFKEKLINAANGKIDIEEITNLTENFA